MNYSRKRPGDVSKFGDISRLVMVRVAVVGELLHCKGSDNALFLVVKGVRTMHTLFTALKLRTVDYTPLGQSFNGALLKSQERGDRDIPPTGGIPNPRTSAE